MDDLERNVWCLLGLPFDAVTMDETIERIHHAVRTREKCFISTPNLNFLIASQKDSDFRDSVINSDLSVADGKPLIWIARLLNIPLPERVAGSDIIDRLIENEEGYKSIKVFFFGGQDGVAKEACEKLKAQSKGLQCVGFHNPGFGSIEEMSTPAIINAINQADADFIIVSLGAKKGQSWIQLNKNKLEAPVISHLGAVVNFIAGTVKRAPQMMQEFGLEWLWRIKEEPALYSRYILDGSSFINLLFTKVLIYRLVNKNNDKSTKKASITMERVNHKSVIIYLTGNLTDNNKLELIDLFKADENKLNNIKMVINSGTHLDGSFLALFLMMRKQSFINGGTFSIETDDLFLKKIFNYNSCNYLIEQ